MSVEIYSLSSVRDNFPPPPLVPLSLPGTFLAPFRSMLLPPDIKYKHSACLLLLTDDGMSWQATRLAVTKSRQDTRPPHSAAAAT